MPAWQQAVRPRRMPSAAVGAVRRPSSLLSQSAHAASQPHSRLRGNLLPPTLPAIMQAAIIASGEARLQGGKPGEQLIGGGEPVGGERSGLPVASVPVIPIINA